MVSRLIVVCLVFWLIGGSSEEVTSFATESDGQKDDSTFAGS